MNHASDLTPPMAALLDSTERLVYAAGIHATGIDAIVKNSGVARKTIYSQYPTKRALVAAALERRHVRWMRWFVEATSTATEPRARLLSAFPALREWFGTPDFHGCAFLNVSGEVGDPDDQIRVIARTHKQRLLAYLQALAQAGGYAQPDLLARQLLMLINGAIADALVFGGTDAADMAERAAERLLQPAPSGSRPFL